MTLVSATARINGFPQFTVGDRTTGRRLDRQLTLNLDETPTLRRRFDPNTDTVRGDNQRNTRRQTQGRADRLWDHDSTSTIDGNCHPIENTICLGA